jgi:hypothetical protein
VSAGRGWLRAGPAAEIPEIPDRDPTEVDQKFEMSRSPRRLRPISAALSVFDRSASTSIRGFFPEHIGLLDDPRLGFHHTTISTATVGN